MDDKIQLIGIGYWHSLYEPDLPDPGNFVDEEWDNNERLKIVKYLQEGLSMPYAAGGVSWCRFRCGINSLGALEFTDGKYVWPEGLLHYVEKHKIRLPQEVIDFMLTNSTIRKIEKKSKLIGLGGKNKKAGMTLLGLSMTHLILEFYRLSKSITFKN